MARSSDSRYKDLPQRTTYTPPVRDLGGVPGYAPQQAPAAPSFMDRRGQYADVAARGYASGYGNNYGGDVHDIEHRGGSIGRHIEEVAAVFGLGHAKGRTSPKRMQEIRKPLGPSSSVGTRAHNEAVELTADTINRTGKVIAGRTPADARNRMRGEAKFPSIDEYLSGGADRHAAAPRHMDLDPRGQIPEDFLDQPLKHKPGPLSSHR